MLDTRDSSSEQLLSFVPPQRTAPRPAGGVIDGGELVFPARRLAAMAWRRGGRSFEGYVAKHEASAYEGGPTRRSFKMKQSGRTVAEDRRQRRILQAPSAR